MICPDCKYDNIPGVDVCESCGHDLRSLDLPSAEDEFTHHLLNDQLGEIEMKEPQSVAPSDPVYYAIHLMQEHETGCVLVHDGDTLVGIMTDRDILLKAAGDRVDLNALTVGQLMTPDPVVLRDNEPLAVAIHKMSIGGFRHIPVVKEGRPTRILSIRDVFRHIAAFIREEPTPV